MQGDAAAGQGEVEVEVEVEGKVEDPRGHNVCVCVCVGGGWRACQLSQAGGAAGSRQQQAAGAPARPAKATVAPVRPACLPACPPRPCRRAPAGLQVAQQVAAGRILHHNRQRALRQDDLAQGHHKRVPQAGVVQDLAHHIRVVVSNLREVWQGGRAVLGGGQAGRCRQRAGSRQAGRHP